MTHTAANKNYIFLCDITEPKEESGLLIPFDDRANVAVFKYEGQFYVMNDKCSHGDASLCEGEIDGDEVECPFHAGAFSFVTGEPTAAPCTIPMKVYRTKVIEDQLYMVDEHA